MASVPTSDLTPFVGLVRQIFIERILCAWFGDRHGNNPLP